MHTTSFRLWSDHPTSFRPGNEGMRTRCLCRTNTAIPGRLDPSHGLEHRPWFSLVLLSSPRQTFAGRTRAGTGTRTGTGTSRCCSPSRVVAMFVSQYSRKLWTRPPDEGANRGPSTTSPRFSLRRLFCSSHQRHHLFGCHRTWGSPNSEL